MQNDIKVTIHDERAVFTVTTTLSKVLADMDPDLRGIFRHTLLASGSATLPPDDTADEPGQAWVQVVR